MIDFDTISRAEWIIRRPQKETLAFVIIINVLPPHTFAFGVGAGLKFTVARGKPRYTALDIEINSHSDIWIRQSSPTRTMNWRNLYPSHLTPTVQRLLDDHRELLLKTLTKVANQNKDCYLDIFEPQDSPSKVVTNQFKQTKLPPNLHARLLAQLQARHVSALMTLFKLKVEDLPKPLQRHLIPKLI